MLIAISLLFIVPILTIVSISITDERSIIEHGYNIWPKAINWDAYRFALSNLGQVVNSFNVTFTYSCIGTLFSLLFMMMCSYSLSRKKFQYRRFISLYIFFTMLFSGGLIPGYILNTQYLHLQNTLTILIISNLINVWYLFILRAFIQEIHESIIESAYMDGANEFRIFFAIIVPLAKPAMATIGLFVFLNYWNEWMTALIYIDNPKLYPLQYLLQKILQDLDMILQNMDKMPQLSGLAKVPSESVRMALAVIAMGPVLLILPFFQKYFVRGISIGSVKG